MNTPIAFDRQRRGSGFVVLLFICIMATHMPVCRFRLISSCRGARHTPKVGLRRTLLPYWMMDRGQMWFFRIELTFHQGCTCLCRLFKFPSHALYAVHTLADHLPSRESSHTVASSGKAPSAPARCAALRNLRANARTDGSVLNSYANPGTGGAGKAPSQSTQH